MTRVALRPWARRAVPAAGAALLLLKTGYLDYGCTLGGQPGTQQSVVRLQQAAWWPAAKAVNRRRRVDGAARSRLRRCQGHLLRRLRPIHTVRCGGWKKQRGLLGMRTPQHARARG
jgi:hypothetical protein